MSEDQSPPRNLELPEPQLSPGPRTRRQLLLSGESIDETAQLPRRQYTKRTTKPAPKQSGTSQSDSEPPASPAPRELQSLTWDDYVDEPDFNSSLLSVPPTDLTYLKGCKFPSGDRGSSVRGISLLDAGIEEESEEEEDDLFDHQEEVFEDAPEDAMAAQNGAEQDVGGPAVNPPGPGANPPPGAQQEGGEHVNPPPLVPPDPGIILAHRTLIDEVDMFVEDDLTFDMYQVSRQFLALKLDQAEGLRVRLRGAVSYLKNNATELYNREIKDPASLLRRQMAQFALKGQGRLREMAHEEASTPRSVTEKAAAATRDIKAAAVQKHSANVVTEMKKLELQLENMRFDPTLDQAGFRREEQLERLLAKQVDAAKSDAQRLRADAVDAGLAQAAQQLDDGVRDMASKQLVLTKELSRHRRERNLPSVTGTGGGSRTTCDVSPPVFSGNPSDKMDFYKFQRELKEYEAVKNPSKEEMLRVILTKCLTGEALTACENMRDRETIMTHLQGAFGNTRQLLNRLLDDLRKLGNCVGSETKQRAWCMSMRSKLLYVQSVAEEHQLERVLFHTQIATEVQGRFPEKIKEDFHLILEKELEEGATEVPQEKVFAALLKYLETLFNRFNFRANLATRVNEVEHVGSKSGGDHMRKAGPVKKSYNVEEAQDGHGYSVEPYTGGQEYGGYEHEGRGFGGYEHGGYGYGGYGPGGPPFGGQAFGGYGYGGGGHGGGGVWS